MQKYITVAVAGHVDHGKTTLVKCLTGIDTDRMEEEKRRGLSIETGVAPLGKEDDLHLAVVDVPGHKDFLKNTIRGLSCVDMAILVVAADDGVMPQTRDHMEILSFCGARSGLVILSKSDLVDEETLELAEMEVHDLVQGRFLQDKPIFRFSSKHPDNIHLIKKTLVDEARMIRGKHLDGPFRLWIDQIRQVKGFGTIVNGTVYSGIIRRDDPLELMPDGNMTRARFIESHGTRIDMAHAGQRIGINLHKVSMEQVARGMVLTAPRTCDPWFLINGELHVLPGERSTLKNRIRVKLYMGTAVVNALLVIMELDEIMAGESALVQLRLGRALVAQPGDHFVISLLNENKVIGGGAVLEVTREKFRQSRSGPIVASLTHLKNGDIGSFVDEALALSRNRLVNIDQIHKRCGQPARNVEAIFAERCLTGKAMEVAGKGYIRPSYFENIREQVMKAALRAMDQGHLKSHTNIREISGYMGAGVDEDLIGAVVNELIREKKLIKETDGLRIPQYTASLSDEDDVLACEIIQFARQSGFVPFSANQFCLNQDRFKNKDKVRKMLHFLHHQHRLIRLNNKRFIGAGAMEEIKNKIISHLARHDALTLSDTQAILGYGRTFTVSVLEYLDSINFTRRFGDKRLLEGEAEAGSMA